MSLENIKSRIKQFVSFNIETDYYDDEGKEQLALIFRDILFEDDTVVRNLLERVFSDFQTHARDLELIGLPKDVEVDDDEEEEVETDEEVEDEDEEEVEIEDEEDFGDEETEDKSDEEETIEDSVKHKKSKQINERVALEKTDSLYAEVVYLQGGEAVEALGILEDRGEDFVIQYLSQWDMGEYNNVYSDPRKVAGTKDTIYESDDYVLIYNEMLDYISLFSKIDKYEFITRYGEEQITETKRYKKSNLMVDRANDFC